jgi:hypothetical protein
MHHRFENLTVGRDYLDLEEKITNADLDVVYATHIKCLLTVIQL